MDWEYLIGGIILIAILLGLKKGIEKAITTAIGEIPSRVHTIRMEELKQANSLVMQKDQQKETRELQVDNYYRSISGETVKNLFSNWTDMIADIDKIGKIKPVQLTKMVKELMMYGSPETVHIGSVFLQYNYRIGQEHIKKNPFLLLYLGSKLVASMKKDFTGYDVDPEDLIRMKINDLHTDNKEQLLRDAKKDIENILKNGF